MRVQCPLCTGTVALSCSRAVAQHNLGRGETFVLYSPRRKTVWMSHGWTLGQQELNIGRGLWRFQSDTREIDEQARASCTCVSLCCIGIMCFLFRFRGKPRARLQHDAANEQRFTDIIIQSLTNRRLKFRAIPLNMTVADIKLRILDEWDAPAPQQVLICQGKPMEDRKTLEYYNLGEGKEHLLRFVLRMASSFAPGRKCERCGIIIQDSYHGMHCGICEGCGIVVPTDLKHCFHCGKRKTD